MAHLSLDAKKIARCRELARSISRPVEAMIGSHTTVGLERGVLRLLGVNGAITRAGQQFPEANAVVEELHREKALGRARRR
jgi:beta-lysine 5,6-aminomutase alpha subunit